MTRIKKVISIDEELLEDWEGWERMPPEQLVQYFQHSCFGEEDDEAWIEPTVANISYEPAYPLSRFMTPEMGNRRQWAAWFKKECKMADDDGREGYYDDMLSREIEEPICLSEINGVPRVFDGWHRLGASFFKGTKFIRAVVTR